MNFEADTIATEVAPGPLDEAAEAKDDEFTPFLVAPCTVLMREAPDADKANFTVVRKRIEPPIKSGKGSSALTRFLLIGFDTEYQLHKHLYTHDEIVKEGKGRYEVLSYQAYAKIDGVELRMIVVPDANRRENFVDFISYVLAKLSSKGISIPRHIVLVGHFNKADFPAFADRGQAFKKLAAIRSSLVTLAYPIKIRIMFSGDENDFEEVSVHVRDSILMAPVGQRSLAAIGELIGKEKMKLHGDPAIELDLKRNMKVVRDNLWELFREYAELDAEVSALYFERLTEFYRATANANSIPTALSNIGVKLLLNDWKDRLPQLNRLEVIGKEAIQEAVWNDATGAFNTYKEEPYIEEVSWYIDFATECYHGGRSEQMWFGPSNVDEFSDYDLQAAYPTAMSMLTAPDWRSVRPTKDIADLRLGRFSFACVDFGFPDTVRYPTLPVRTSRGILFPLAGRSYCCAPEIELALSLGAQLTIKHAVVIDTSNEQVFLPFIKQSIRFRAEAESDLERALWKEITNSCYGKTAQGLREKRVFNLKSKKTQPIPESPITNPFFAAYITSMVRAVVGEIINSIPSDKAVFSVTTDGFLTNANGEEIGWATCGPIAKTFSDARRSLTGVPNVLTKKHSVKRLLGWRTRGQATLQCDLAAGDKGIVLAKAGIKTPPYARTASEQNEYIVEQFLTRTPGRKFIVDTQTTYREIMLFNADLVTKRSERAISMEYDFKRRPARAYETLVGHDDNVYSHLAFSTEPWRTAEEFKLARDIWESYSHKKIKVRDVATKKLKTVRRQCKCLMTASDFRSFAAFHDMKIAVKGKGASYMRSDLSRLRLDLCTAYQRGAAGLDGCRDRYTAQQFADILNQCGFEGEVTRTHVEYGARRKFTPHTTPPTDRTVRVLRLLGKVIPSLRSPEILASMEGLSLLLPALEPQ